MCTCAALLVEVQELRARVAVLEAGHASSDPAADTRLLAALAGAFGSAVFSAADLVQHARHDAAVQRALAGASARRVGKWLRRLSTKPGPGTGYRVQRIGRDGAGVVWAVTVRD